MIALDLPGGPVVCGAIAICPSVGATLGGAADAVGGGVTSSVVDAVFAGVLSGIEGAVTAGISRLSVLLGPDPTLTAGWYGSVFGAMGAVAGLVVGPLLFVATIGAVIRQDPARLVRVWFVALPASVVGTAIAVPVVQLALRASGQLSGVLTTKADTAASVRSLVGALVPPLATLDSGLLAAVLGALLLLGVLALSLELILRDAAIYLTVLFMPLILSAAVWPPMLGAVKRALEVLAALILSKFVITAALVLGASMLGSGAGVDTDLIGVAVLLLAAFAPVAVLRLLPLIEGAAIGHLEGRSRQPLRAGRQAAHSAHGSLGPVGAAFGLGGPTQAAQVAMEAAIRSTDAVSGLSGADLGDAGGGTTSASGADGGDDAGAPTGGGRAGSAAPGGDGGGSRDGAAMWLDGAGQSPGRSGAQGGLVGSSPGTGTGVAGGGAVTTSGPPFAEGEPDPDFGVGWLDHALAPGPDPEGAAPEPTWPSPVGADPAGAPWQT